MTVYLIYGHVEYEGTFGRYHIAKDRETALRIVKELKRERETFTNYAGKLKFNYRVVCEEMEIE